MAASGGQVSVGVAFAVLLTACGGPSPRTEGDGGVALTGGSVLEKQARFNGLRSANCPNDEHVDQQIDVDGSGSSLGLADQRLPIVLASARITAICGGKLRVVVFSRSISDVRPVISETLDPGHGTYASKVIKADKSIAQLFQPVRRGLAHPRVEKYGTDLLGVLQDASETKLQWGRPDHFRLLVITDGEATVGPHIGSRVSPSEASELASHVAVPDLAGADVRFTGVGLVGDHRRQPTTAHTTALKAFLQTVCNRATRSTCHRPTTRYTN